MRENHCNSIQWPRSGQNAYFHAGSLDLVGFLLGSFNGSYCSSASAWDSSRRRRSRPAAAAAGGGAWEQQQLAEEKIRSWQEKAAAPWLAAVLTSSLVVAAKGEDCVGTLVGSICFHGQKLGWVLGFLRAGDIENIMTGGVIFVVA